MHLVMEGAERQDQAIAHDDTLVTGMRRRRRQREVLQVKNDKQRVRRHDEVDQHRAEIDQMLARVHRQAGPGADVGIAVMHRMHAAVQRRPVNQAVDQKKIKRLPGRQQQYQENHPRPARLQIEGRGIAVRHRPHHQHLIGTPDGYSAGEGPENIVTQLRIEGECPRVGRERPHVVAAFVALFPPDVKIQMQAAGDENQQYQVAQIDLRDPVRREFTAALKRGMEVSPRQYRQQQNDEPLRQRKPAAQHPSQYRHGIRRPTEIRRNLQRQGRRVMPGFPTPATFALDGLRAIQDFRHPAALPGTGRLESINQFFSLMRNSANGIM